MTPSSRIKEFTAATARGDWQRQCQMFAELAADHEKLRIAVNSLLLSICDGDETEDKAMKVQPLNDIAQMQRGKDVL